jgi:monofunctional biosynthetic peptidoglycan transglycosylase
VRKRLGLDVRTLLRAAAVLAAIGFAVLVYVYVTLPDVRVLATKNPGSTAFMELRSREAKATDRKLRHEHRWVPYGRISPNLKRAVLTAEDDLFFQHEGIDVDQIRASIEVNLRRGAAVRGASTITQQLAKNLYLSPSRNPLRKVRELIIARRLEAELPKWRIFEIYLNVIEWGDGVWGVEAAAREHFGVSASALSREQSALLAGAIVNPRLLNPGRPSRRLLRRQRIILANMQRAELPPTIAAAPKRESSPPVRVAPAKPEPVEPIDDEDLDAIDRAPEPVAPSADAPTAPAGNQIG